MKRKDMIEHELTEVNKRILKEGILINLKTLEVVLDCYAEYIEDELPEVDGDLANNFILDNLMFDPLVKEEVSKETLERIHYWNVEYLKTLGIIPEDEEGEEDE